MWTVNCKFAQYEWNSLRYLTVRGHGLSKLKPPLSLMPILHCSAWWLLMDSIEIEIEIQLYCGSAPTLGKPRSRWANKIDYTPESVRQSCTCSIVFQFTEMFDPSCRKAGWRQTCGTLSQVTIELLSPNQYCLSCFMIHIQTHLY